MRTQKRLQIEKERIEEATSHAMRARQLFLYSAPDVETLKALNDTVRTLTEERSK